MELRLSENDTTTPRLHVQKHDNNYLFSSWNYLIIIQTLLLADIHHDIFSS